jgi:hypothetical protein
MPEPDLLFLDYPFPVLVYGQRASLRSFRLLSPPPFYENVSRQFAPAGLFFSLFFVENSRLPGHCEAINSSRIRVT